MILIELIIVVESLFIQEGYFVETFWFYLSVGIVLDALLGLAIGNSKGRALAGFFFGMFLGPLGWLIIAIGPNNLPKCPECGGLIAPNANKCKNCGCSLNRSAKPSNEFLRDPVYTNSTNAEKSPGNTKECFYCAETIKANAKICRFCNREQPNMSVQKTSDAGQSNVAINISELKFENEAIDLNSLK